MELRTKRKASGSLLLGELKSKSMELGTGKNDSLSGRSQDAAHKAAKLP